MHNGHSASIMHRIRDFGIDNLISVGMLIALALAYILGWIDPAILSFINRSHYFESIVLLVLAQLLWKSHFNQRSSPFAVLTEDEFVEDLKDRVIRNRVAEVRILSGGLASRITLVSWLLDQGVKVRILALDNRDNDGMPDRGDTDINLATITKHMSEEVAASLFVVGRYNDVAALRCAILYDRKQRPLHVYVGWYTYRNRGRTMIGFPNPTISVAAGTKDGRAILEFAENEFNSKMPGQSAVTSFR